jgi:hypothetical protein
VLPMVARRNDRALEIFVFAVRGSIAKLNRRDVVSAIEAIRGPRVPGHLLLPCPFRIRQSAMLACGGGEPRSRSRRLGQGSIMQRVHWGVGKVPDERIR